MADTHDLDPQELLSEFREAVIRWLDRARHLTPGDGFEIGHLVARLEDCLLAESGPDLVARRMALVGEVQLRLSDVNAPEALIAAAGHLKGRPPAAAKPASPATPQARTQVPPQAKQANAMAPAPRGVPITRPAVPAPPAEAPAEPWKRVPLKKLARAVPSARIVVDPIDMAPPPQARLVNPSR